MRLGVVVWKPTPVAVGARKKVPDVATREDGTPLGRLAVKTPEAFTVPVEKLPYSVVAERRLKVVSVATFHGAGAREELSASRENSRFRA